MDCQDEISDLIPNFGFNFSFNIGLTRMLGLLASRYILH